MPNGDNSLGYSHPVGSRYALRRWWCGLNLLHICVYRRKCRWSDHKTTEKSGDITYNTLASSFRVLGSMNRTFPPRKRETAVYATQPAMRVSSRAGCSISQLIQFSLRRLVSESVIPEGVKIDTYVRWLWAIASGTGGSEKPIHWVAQEREMKIERKWIIRGIAPDSAKVKQTCDRRETVFRASPLGMDTVTLDSTMLLFSPPSNPYNTTRFFRFLREINEKHHLELESFQDLYQWSISHIDLFWSHVWDHSRIIGNKGNHVVDTTATPAQNPPWFTDSLLNYAENLLVNLSPDTTAIVQVGKRFILPHLRSLGNQFLRLQ